MIVVKIIGMIFALCVAGVFAAAMILTAIDEWKDFKSWAFRKR